MSKITIGALLAALVLPTSVFAHNWYPSSCCAGNDSTGDCRPVPCNELVETEDGWKHVPSGVRFTKSMEHPTQDRNCHVCIGVSADRDGKPVYSPHCVFILPST